MNRWALAVCVLILAAAVLPAQTIPDFTALDAAFGGFVDALAGELASTAVTCLAWSPAHIGQFPHFGIGLSAGATMMPYAAIAPFIEELGGTLPTGLSFMETAGIPLPSAAIDARIGGFALPFDVGLKIGFIPDGAEAVAENIRVEHFTVGADVRFAILQDKGWVPGLSIGAGYSYLKGGLHIAGVTGEDSTVDIYDIMTIYGGKPGGGTYELVYADPDLDLTWESHVIEARVQLSKTLLIFTPHVGFGAAYAIRSTVGGALASPVSYLENGSPGDMDDVEAACLAAGETPPADVEITAGSDAPGWTLQVFGGTSINLWVLRIDLDAKWNVLTGSYGGNVNFRFEL
jgi:hypothetical protein